MCAPYSRGLCWWLDTLLSCPVEGVGGTREKMETATYTNELDNLLHDGIFCGKKDSPECNRRLEDGQLGIVVDKSWTDLHVNVPRSPEPRSDKL